MELADRGRVGRAGLSESLRRLTSLPRADWGKSIAHAGLGLTFISIAGIMAWEEEMITVLAPGQSLELAGYQVTLESVARLPVGADFHIPGCGHA